MQLLNLVDEFINKNICPYCGGQLLWKNVFQVAECENCKSKFRFCDQPGPDSYYFPREMKETDYCYTSKNNTQNA